MLRRSDAAGFAAALDFDGAFAAPRARPEPGVRTITLTRSPAPADDRHDVSDTHGALVRTAARRPPRSGLERIVDAPDRIALMAVALGVLLVIIAAATSASA